jgi:four helix bundle protein
MELAVCVYRLTQHFPREEAFGLTSQLRRSAVSIPSNVAEGHGRMNPREFKHFLLIVRAATLANAQGIAPKTRLKALQAN